MAFDFDKIHDRRATDSAKWNYFPEDVLPMWVADMDFSVPPAITAALHKRVEEGIFGYAITPPSLLEAITSRLQRLYGWTVQHEEIVPLSGLVSGLNITTRAVGERGDGVLVNPPVYAPFFSAATNQHRTLQSAQQSLTVEDGIASYCVDFEALDAAVEERTRLMLLCNPQNPTGATYTRADLESFAALAARHDLIMCSDEIHCDLLLDGAQHIPLAALSPEIAARTITLMAPSKTFNIPGLGASFAVIQNKELRERFVKASTGIVPHMSLLAGVAMQAAYSECEDWLAELRVYLTANRDFAVDYVRKHMPGVNVTIPQATYLLWMDLRAFEIEGAPDKYLMDNARVALTSGAWFGGEGFVRLNFGCPRATLAEGLDRIAESLSSIQ